MYALLLTALMAPPAVTQAQLDHGLTTTVWTGSHRGEFTSLVLHKDKRVGGPVLTLVAADKSNTGDRRIRSWIGGCLIRANEDRTIVCCAVAANKTLTGGKTKVDLLDGTMVTYVIIFNPKYLNGDLIAFDARFVGPEAFDAPTRGATVTMHFDPFSSR